MVDKELKIKKIKNGTVIDHLPAGTALTVLHLLGIENDYKEPVSVAMNVSSKSSGMKDVVKVENRALRPDETNKLALIAPDLTINIIRNYEVVKKNKVTVPESVIGMLKCGNPNCITNQKEPSTPAFTLESKNPLRLRCKFCERIMERDLIEEQF
jgi:aspartate carbamoyltransferase regulatory subunit